MRRQGDRKSVHVAVLPSQDNSLYHLYSVAFGARHQRRGGKEFAKQTCLLLLWFAALTGFCTVFSSHTEQQSSVIPPITASAHQALHMAQHGERLSL